MYLPAQRIRYRLVLLALAVTLAACSTSRKVEVVQSRDSSLSCAELRQEFKRLDEVQADIVQNRGSGNLAALIFWLPGVAFSEGDADKAMALVRERRDHLTRLWQQKGCES